MHQNWYKLRITNMDTEEQKFAKLWANINTPSSTSAIGNVMLSINIQEQKMVRHRAIFFSLSLLASVALLVREIILIPQRLYETGVSTFVSSILYDFHSVSEHWQSLLISILESMPFLDLILGLASLLIVVIFARFVSIYMRAMRNNLLTIN